LIFFPGSTINGNAFDGLPQFRDWRPFDPTTLGERDLHGELNSASLDIAVAGGFYGLRIESFRYLTFLHKRCLE